MGESKVHSILANVTIIGKSVGYQIAFLCNWRVIGGQDQLSIMGSMLVVLTQLGTPSRPHPTTPMRMKLIVITSL